VSKVKYSLKTGGAEQLSVHLSDFPPTVLTPEYWLTKLFHDEDSYVITKLSNNTNSTGKIPWRTLT